MNNRIAIIGTASGDINDSLKNECRELGQWLAKSELLVVTGAGPGIPYYVGQSVVDNGGNVIGYSPGTKKEEHISKFHFPRYGFNELRFLTRKYNINEVYFRRSLNIIHDADIVIGIGGGKGTISELFLATFFSKKIICASFAMGSSQEYIKIYKYLREINITYGERILVANNLEEIKMGILSFMNKNEE